MRKPLFQWIDPEGLVEELKSRFSPEIEKGDFDDIFRIGYSPWRKKTLDEHGRISLNTLVEDDTQIGIFLKKIGSIYVESGHYDKRFPVRKYEKIELQLRGMEDEPLVINGEEFDGLKIRFKREAQLSPSGVLTNDYKDIREDYKVVYGFVPMPTDLSKFLPSGAFLKDKGLAPRIEIHKTKIDLDYILSIIPRVD